MRAGKLRHKVVIEQRSEASRNSFGESIDAWAEFATRWASVAPLQGQERMVAQQTQANVTHRVVMRNDDALATVSPAMRIRHKLHTAANAGGTATGGGSTFILLEAEGTQPDDTFNGWGILLTGGTGAGQFRMILNYDHTGNIAGERWARVGEVFDTNPTATSTYVIARWLNIAEVLNPNERNVSLEILCVEAV